MTNPSPRKLVGTALLLCWTLLSGAWLAAAEDWPQIMGPDRSGKIEEASPAFPSETVEPIWTRKVGSGFAGPVVKGDAVVLFHRSGNEEIVEALDSSTGQTKWRSSYPTTYRDDFGFDEGPRSPPTIAGNRVFTFGAQGKLTAFDFSNGRMLWQVDTKKVYEVPKGFFGAAGSPLVVGDRVLLNVGGKGAGIVAFDAAKGTELWKVTDDEASYSSGVALHGEGRENLSHAVFFTRNGLCIVDVSDGQVTHTYPWRSRLRSSANAALPLVLEDNILLSASYGVGSAMLDIGASPPSQVWSAKDAIASHYAPIVAVDNTLYGMHGRVEYGAELQAVDAGSGEVLWTEKTGSGALIAVGDVLLVLLDTGELIFVRHNRAKYEPLGTLQLFQSTSRALPAYSNGVFFARDQEVLGAWRFGSSE